MVQGGGLHAAEGDNCGTLPIQIMGRRLQGITLMKRGVFYCLDITELAPELQCLLADQGMHSVLQCSITADGV